MSATAGVWDAEGFGDADGALLERVHDGDSEAYGQLWRRHLPSAFNVANRYSGRASAEDIVAEASLRVYERIRAGNGPTSNFRSYFLSTVKTVAIDLTRAELRLVPTPAEGLEDGSAAVQPYNPALRVDQDLVRAAFERLSQREQQLLWRTAVEATPATVVAPMMGLSANGVRVAALRARNSLRAHYLDVHANRALERANSDECHWVLSRLGRYVRDNLRASQRNRIERHLLQCRHANVVLAELAEANRALPALMVPIVFVGGTGSAALWASARIPAGAGEGNLPTAATAETPSSPAASAATATSGALVKAAAVAVASALGAALVAAPTASNGPAIADRSQTQGIGGSNLRAGPTELTSGWSVPPATAADTSPNTVTGPASAGVTATPDITPVTMEQAAVPNRTTNASDTAGATTSNAAATGSATTSSLASGPVASAPFSSQTKPQYSGTPKPAKPMPQTPSPPPPGPGSPPPGPAASSPGLRGVTKAIANVEAQNPQAHSNALAALQKVAARLTDKQSAAQPSSGPR